MLLGINPAKSSNAGITDFVLYVEFKHPFENLNRICILLLCKNMNLRNYVELVHGVFSGLLFPSTFLFIHFINFWEFTAARLN